MRLEIDNWRWSGVPWFIRTGEATAGHTDRGAPGIPPPAAARLPSVDWEPGAGREPAGDQARPDRPESGSPSTRTGPTRAAPQEITLDMEFAQEGGEGPTPYEVLLHGGAGGQQRAVHPAGQSSRRRGGS